MTQGIKTLPSLFQLLEYDESSDTLRASQIDKAHSSIKGIMRLSLKIFILKTQITFL